MTTHLELHLRACRKKGCLGSAPFRVPTLLAAVEGLVSGAWGTIGCAAEYWVSRTGNDAASRSAAQPWATIGRAIRDAQPGDAITLTAGEYRETVVIDRSGLPGQPITLQAAPDTKVVVASPSPGQAVPGLDFARVSHWVVQNLELTGFGCGIMIRDASHHLRFVGCRAYDCSVAVFCRGATDLEFEDCEAARCSIGFEFYSSRRFSFVRCAAHDIKIGPDKDADGFSIDRSCSEVLLDECESYRNEHAGFDIKATSMVVRKCKSHNNYWGVKLPYGEAFIEECLIYRNHDLGVLADTGTANPVRLLRCTIAENEAQGIQLGFRQRPPDPVDPLRTWCTGVLPWLFEDRTLFASYDVLIRDCTVAFNKSRAIDFDATVRLVCDHTTLYHEDPDFGLIVRRGQPQIVLTANQVAQGALPSAALPQFGPGISVKRPAIKLPD